MEIKALVPILSKLIVSDRLPGYLESICRKIVREQTTLASVLEDLRSLDIHENVAKSDFTGLILDYLEAAMDDGVLTEEEKSEILFLNRLFRIRSEEFRKYHRDRVEDLVDSCLDMIYEDDDVSFQESVLKDDLQEILGFSYDEMNDHVKRWARNSILKGANIENLDVLFTHQEYQQILAARQTGN